MIEDWVYVDYMPEELEQARRAVELLKGPKALRGSVFWMEADQLKPLPGQRVLSEKRKWTEKIKALRASFCVLILCSPRRYLKGLMRDGDSGPVRELFAEILETGIPVIPVYFERCQLPDYLEGIHPGDLSTPSGVLDVSRAIQKAWYDDRTRIRDKPSPTAPDGQLREPPDEARDSIPAPHPPSDLIDACAAGDCVLYSGAGLGAAAGYPTWKPLIKSLLAWAASESLFDAAESRRLKVALDGNEVNLVADSIVRSAKRQGHEQGMVDFLAGVFQSTGNPLPERFRNLGQLGLSAALTTSFDPLLEQTFSISESQSLTRQDTEALLSRLSSKEFFVGKLYGRLSDPETVILSPPQYEEAVTRSEAFGQFMESLFVSRTLLFLGCSMEGILDYLGGVRITGTGRRHYALVGVEGPVWETKAAYLLDRYGIQVIPYPLGIDQEAVDRFVATLCDDVAERRRVSVDQPTLGSGAPGGSSPQPKGLVEELRLENIGAFSDLRLKLDPHWNVLLGDNGVGKSTVLKALALAFCGKSGSDYAERLLMAGQSSGRITVWTKRQEYVTGLSRTRSGVEVTSHPDRPLDVEGWLTLGFPALRTITWRAARVGEDEGRARPMPQDLLPLLSGDADPRLDEVKDWIVSLDYWMHRNTAGEKPGRAAEFREGLFELLTDITRTPGLRFDRVDSESNRVLVATGGLSIPIEAMSQGTASLLGWLGVLVRRLLQVSPPNQDPLERNALVLIDELDAHMHPAWQQIVVKRLGERFPNIQFIATTHSPLVVAGLDADQVVRFRRAEDGAVVAEAPPHDLKGLGVAGLLTSDLFSLATQLDPETEQDLARKRELASRDDLTEDEREELGKLDARLGSVDFSTMVRDPLYSLFVRTMTELQSEPEDREQTATVSPDAQERQRALARQVLGKLLKREGSTGQGDEE